jgi:hypothetical protein
LFLTRSIVGWAPQASTPPTVLYQRLSVTRLRRFQYVARSAQAHLQDVPHPNIKQLTQAPRQLSFPVTEDSSMIDYRNRARRRKIHHGMPVRTDGDPT